MRNLGDFKARMVPGQKFALPYDDNAPIEREYIVTGVDSDGFYFDDRPGRAIIARNKILWYEEENWSIHENSAHWRPRDSAYTFLRILLPVDGDGVDNDVR